jgi:manganese oxidase
MIRRDANGDESLDNAKPGENGAWSLCPENAGRKSFNVHFIKLPIQIAKSQGKEPPVIDPNGLIYVLHEEEAAIRAKDDLKYPLVVRGNIYDCIDWTLTQRVGRRRSHELSIIEDQHALAFPSIR